MNGSPSVTRTYPAPPESFDPQTAPDYLLCRHGGPRRPDPGSEPELSQLWNAAFAGGEAELAGDRRTGGRRPPVVPADPSVPQGWSGALRRQTPGTDYSEPATMVYAQWVIPEVAQVDPGYDEMEVGFWVGLDGAAEMELLQAGVAATITRGDFSTGVEWWAFTEWYTEEVSSPAQTVVNFPAGPGEVIAGMVCARPDNAGLVSLANLTRKIATSVGVPAPAGLVSLGTTAEWIVEVPQGPALASSPSRSPTARPARTRRSSTAARRHSHQHGRRPRRESAHPDHDLVADLARGDVARL